MRDSEGIQTALASVGFDICYPFHPKLYNDCIQERNLPLQPLPETGLGYLIGNTKHFWPIFLKWWQQQQQQQQPQKDTIQHPVETYTKDKIMTVLNHELETGTTTNKYDVFWSNEHNMDRLVSMQRVASCSGFAYLDEISHLTVHPVYGTWHSFRAVVVIADEDPKFKKVADIIVVVEPTLQPCLLTAEEQDVARFAMEKALQASDRDRLCDQLHGGAVSEETAAAWISLRDCMVSRGKDFRFDETQLWYHYTKDVKYLEAAALKEMIISDNI
jgi:hypothetical protein